MGVFSLHSGYITFHQPVVRAPPVRTTARENIASWTISAVVFYCCLEENQQQQRIPFATHTPGGKIWWFQMRHCLSNVIVVIQYLRVCGEISTDHPSESDGLTYDDVWKCFSFFFLICLDRRRKILVRTTLWVCGASVSMPLHRRIIYGISIEIFPETRVYSIYFSGFPIGHKIRFILQACANDNMCLMSSIYQ